MKKRFSPTLAIAAISALILTACSGGGVNKTADANKFTWWIPVMDDFGVYYSKYEENPAVQWLNSQYWDASAHTLGKKDKGEKLSLSFTVPVAGTQRDSFSTMIATDAYPEIIDLNYADSINALVEGGVLMEITEYVEKYLPNYTAFFERNPQLKKFACETDENGKDHYYKIGAYSDYPLVPWAGFTYRRDWVVKYAVPTEYVWDWDSEYVKANGHAKVTPLSEAVAQNDLAGWKKNETTAFSKSEGSDPNNDYTDNVVFPSGKYDPYTISDWEWMFEAFAKALQERGFENNPNAYCVSLYYPGYESTGELVSSFGGGNGTWYLNDKNEVVFSGSDENFKTYVECMNNWNNKGWLDKKFETRASDMFFQINTTGFSQGMVGMAYTLSFQGDTIRKTCTDAGDQKDAMVFGSALPINDVYGGEAQKYRAPDSQYQDPIVGNSPVGFTKKCEGKNFEVLFTMINWLYSPDGQMFTRGGLNEEQYKSMTFSPDLYATLGITTGYNIEERDGVKTMVLTLPAAETAYNAIRTQRVTTEYIPNSMRLPEYDLDLGYSEVVDISLRQWALYKSTGSLIEYVAFLNDSEAQTYNKTNTYISDYMAQAVPQMIKGGLGEWDAYVKKLAKFAPEKVSEIFQKYVD